MSINNFKDNLTATFGKSKAYLFEDRWTSYLAITLGLIVVVTVGAYIAHKTAVWQVSQIITAKLENKDLQCRTITDTERLKYVNEQRAKIIDHSNTHRQAAIKFYGYFYATFTIFSIFGAVAAITLAVITKRGLDKANNHLMTVFLVSTAIVILYQSFFGVFQQTKNIDSNALLSIGYAKLADEIDTYCVTGKVNAKDPKQILSDMLVKPAPTSGATPAKANEQPGNTNTQENKPQDQPPPNPKIPPFFVSLEADEFINYINWELVRLKDFAVKFDETKFASFEPKRFATTP